MKRFRLVIVILYAAIITCLCGSTVAIACLCSACVPFIDGAVEAKDYFEGSVRCRTFSINPDADNGFDTVDVDNLSLANLTDENEKNTLMQRYYSFTFKAKNEDFTLEAVAFIVEAQEAAAISFQLSNGSSNSRRSIELEAGRIGTVEFTELNFAVAASSDLVITMENPLVANVPYRIDTVIFVI